jgi:hypothetical protein
VSARAVAFDGGFVGGRRGEDGRKRRKPPRANRGFPCDPRGDDEIGGEDSLDVRG